MQYTSLCYSPLPARPALLCRAITLTTRKWRCQPACLEMGATYRYCGSKSARAAAQLKKQSSSPKTLLPEALQFCILSRLWACAPSCCNLALPDAILTALARAPACDGRSGRSCSGGCRRCGHARRVPGRRRCRPTLCRA